MAADNSSPMHQLTTHRVLVFDVYGTLIDWESPIYAHIASLFPANAPKADVLKAYGSVEADIQARFPAEPYTAILERVWKRLALRGDDDEPVTNAGGTASTSTSTATKVDRPDDPAAAFAQSIANWQPFPDTNNALRKLKSHFDLVVLSNVDDNSFRGTHTLLSQPDDTSPFTLILTAQQIGAYKPDSASLTAALDRIRTLSNSHFRAKDIQDTQVLVVANSLFHDILPANARGLRSVWIRRPGSVVGVEALGKDLLGGTQSPPWTWAFDTMDEFANAVEAEARGVV
ncbi:haloacid dehalogenase [Hygrophoropsis aurantiaca]|uniref:Haloacid dehalogenase n=1 Tax=Hygrophoropsis aurantiaca TaxID=72124 RepID=A0ACB8AIE7_9AGAM|nr:haloacid dehalogenase [Hygrophoropsis aurantiaca]